jgi:hypothetical protein
VLLLAVAVLGISRVGAVKHDVNDLGLRKLHAQALIGAIADRSGANAQATTQHLYVYDGDLENEDALQREIVRQFAATDRDASASPASSPAPPSRVRCGPSTPRSSWSRWRSCGSASHSRTAGS